VSARSSCWPEPRVCPPCAPRSLRHRSQSRSTEHSSMSGCRMLQTLLAGRFELRLSTRNCSSRSTRSWSPTTETSGQSPSVEGRRSPHVPRAKEQDDRSAPTHFAIGVRLVGSAYPESPRAGPHRSNGKFRFLSGCRITQAEPLRQAIHRIKMPRPSSRRSGRNSRRVWNRPRSRSKCCHRLADCR
jgi:hypothetical protein